MFLSMSFDIAMGTILGEFECYHVLDKKQFCSQFAFFSPGQAAFCTCSTACVLYPVCSLLLYSVCGLHFVLCLQSTVFILY